MAPRWTQSSPGRLFGGQSPSRSLLQRHVYSSSPFSASAGSRSYEDTLPHLKIGSHTRVLFQGFTVINMYILTGKQANRYLNSASRTSELGTNEVQATANVKESLAWGTKIVGGVKPGVEGEHLGLPIFPSVRVAQEKAKPDASAVYVPGNQTAKAIEEALEAEIPLIVAVAEHVPIHDMLKIHSMLKTQSKSRLVGPNCPGIISAVGKCRIGFQPLPCFAPGNVGIVAKSGTLGYETVASTTRAGLGQSLCIGMGGDVLAGTDFVDALKVFEHDDDTHGIIIVGEIGGEAEMEAAEWIKGYRRRISEAKFRPIMALIGGIEAPPGRVMGHADAGAWTAEGEPDARTKIQALQSAGVVMVDHPEKFGEGMKVLLAGAGRRPKPIIRPSKPARSPQRRMLYIKSSDAFGLLKEQDISVVESKGPANFTLAIAIDRKTCGPCITVSNSTDGNTHKFPFNYHARNFDIASVKDTLGFTKYPSMATESLEKLLHGLMNIFVTKEAFLLEVKAGIAPDTNNIQIIDARFGFDDAAYRSSGRQGDIHVLRNKADEVPAEVEAEKDGIVYITLPGEGRIGTLVNGAGLAMNTVDALTLHGGSCANFLDTGGKATAETVKSSFRVILSDPRVKGIFVNIFGGLTKCDMIAEGIMMAFRDLGMKVPVVVRLRGTNEELGQKMIAESGLPLHAFDSFEQAAKKVISLSK
ncbi:succinyl-CoA synthetase beta subunit, putative [Trichophyton verrucosum HKI 0517]|uniref:Succinyl-CoA synthetase beta subunit, putative n=1 Tax=Trichophyton verrucosum (strain HKI 0517) TaxID=663202 RepID=D4DCT9_TRIVH|nr:succinyl-CoA synthetase beta subunit, putative [Trichophyton verrucosum HKI 0517]EFE40332.1 succinyl-CoA synthetase beta subunit, putative [Trichophyton verrucosum HKI 0517]